MLFRHLWISIFLCNAFLFLTEVTGFALVFIARRECCFAEKILLIELKMNYFHQQDEKKKVEQKGHYNLHLFFSLVCLSSC